MFSGLLRLCRNEEIEYMFRWIKRAIQRFIINTVIEDFKAHGQTRDIFLPENW